MLRISVICQGRLKEKYYADACAEYLKRLSAYGAAEVVELPEESDVAARIPKGAYVIAMAVEGEKLSSEALAARLEKRRYAPVHVGYDLPAPSGAGDGPGTDIPRVHHPRGSEIS